MGALGNPSWKHSVSIDENGAVLFFASSTRGGVISPQHNYTLLLALLGGHLF
jgi:hypothetical protein